MKRRLQITWRTRLKWKLQQARELLVLGAWLVFWALAAGVVLVILFAFGGLALIAVALCCVTALLSNALKAIRGV